MPQGSYCRHCKCPVPAGGKKEHRSGAKHIYHTNPAAKWIWPDVESDTEPTVLEPVEPVEHVMAKIAATVPAWPLGRVNWY